jgi:glycosyltransferase involved in cell wall biosynthesis
MSTSLSLVFPIRNAERTLSSELQQVLDVLSDLTERFEVLLVDEGSTDHTKELAHDLAVEYPQLRIARRLPDDLPASALQAGLKQTTGDVVLVQNRHARFSPSYVRKIWEMGVADRDTVGQTRRPIG